jgi:hypothetical protein
VTAETRAPTTPATAGTTATVVVEVPRGWDNERRYAVNVLLEDILRLDATTTTTDREGTALRLAGEDGEVVVADDLFARPEATRLKPETFPSGSAHVDGVPVLYGGTQVERDASSVRFAADLFGSAFFLLTRYEEVVTRERDRHGRFPGRASFAARHGLLARPLVNEWAELLWRAMTSLWPRLERPRRDFRLLPSHDVDWPLTPERGLRAVGRRTLADIVKRHDLRTAGRRIRSRFGGPNLFDTFDLLMDAAERRGLQSAFYFIVDGPAPELDCGYSLDDPWIRALLRRIDARGHELGLHGSYRSFDDGERLAAERSRFATACADEGIAQSPAGGRQHFLRWEACASWKHWDDAGFEYDASVGFHDTLGFRCGTCTEFRTFDLDARRPLRLRERPLVAMDVALLDRERLTGEAALERLAELKRHCRRFDGDFTLLWHNSRFVNGGERSLYEAALDA